MNGVGVVRSLLVAVLIAGTSALLMSASLNKFVGTGINPHTYSMDRDGFWGMLFNSLVYSAISGLLISLVLWSLVFRNLERIVIDINTLLWSGPNGYFLDLPAYLILLIYLVRHRRADLSRRILNDQSVVFDSWW
jgi:hypothetical protein